MPISFTYGGVSVAIADIANHRMALVSIPPLDTASQLQALLPELEWQAAGAMSAIQYADLARVTGAAMTLHSEIDARSWIGHAVDPAHMANAYSTAALAGMEKARSKLGRSLDAADTELRKAAGDATKDAARDTRLAHTFALPAAGARPPPAWQNLVSYGLLRTSSIGIKALAWLEYFAWERGEAPSADGRASRLLTMLDGLATHLNISKHETEDAARAANAIRALSDYAYMAHCATRYVPVGAGREAQLSEELLAARSPTHTGDTAFAQGLVPTIIANTAPLITAALLGVEGRRGRNELTMELAATYLPTQAAAATLFTAQGIRALEKRLKPRTDLLKSAECRAMDGAARVELLVEKEDATPQAQGTGGSGNVAPASGGGTPSSGVYPANWTARLHARKEEEPNLSILRDVLALLEDPEHSALDVLDVLFRGATEGSPDRKPTGLTHQLAWGKLEPSLVDTRLASIAEYAKGKLGRLLGRAVARKLVLLGLAKEEDVASLKLDALAEAFRGDAWEDHVDLGNMLILPVMTCMHLGDDELALTRAMSFDKNAFYRDLAQVQRLPRLLGAVFEQIGLESSGVSSLRAVVQDSNEFISFHGGVTAKSTSTLTTGQRDLVTGCLKEACEHYSPARNAKNPDATIPPTFVPGSAKEGARGQWAKCCERMLELAHKRRDDAHLELLPQVVSFDGAATYRDDGGHLSATPGRGNQRNPQGRDGERGDDRDRRQDGRRDDSERERDSRGGGRDVDKGVSGAKGGANEFADATYGYRERGDVFWVMSGEKNESIFNAKQLRQDAPKGACIAHLLTQGKGIDGCPCPGDPAHAERGKGAHAGPADFKATNYRIYPEGTGPRGRKDGGRGGVRGGGGKGDGKGRGKGRGKGGGGDKDDRASDARKDDDARRDGGRDRSRE